VFVDRIDQRRGPQKQTMRDDDDDDDDNEICRSYSLRDKAQ